MKILCPFDFLTGLERMEMGMAKASITNDVDVLYSFARIILNYGTDHDNIKLALMGLL